MKLTKAKKNLVLEYARLAALSELSELEADRMGEILELAEKVVPQEALTNEIEAGALEDSHLFHSFSEFNIEKSPSTYFTNPTGIEKVTRARAYLQSQKSDVGAKHLGDKLSVKPKSYNPNASPSGSLKTRPNPSNILGTQDTVRIRDDAIAPFMTPAGGQLLDFSRTSQKGEALAEQNFDFMGDPLAPMLRPYKQLLTFARSLLVRRNEEVDIFALNHSDIGLFSSGDMVLRSSSTVLGDAHYWSGGSFRIEQLDTSSALLSAVEPEADEDSVEIELTTTSLELINGSDMSASTFGVGNAGAVKITATDSVPLDGEHNNGITSAISSRVASGAEGNSGGIELTTSSLEVINGARVSVSTGGIGNAGLVKITATDSVQLDGESINIADNDGNLTITLPNLDFIQNSLTELPDNLIDTDNLLANSCIVRTFQQEGTRVYQLPDGWLVRAREC